MTKHGKISFTLAEVLITLGIIGVVSALTIPTLIKNYQKQQTVTKLKKAYSQINQAYRAAYEDVGDPTLEEAKAMGATAYFNKYWAPYIKYSMICQTYRDCGYDSTTPIKYLNGTRYSMSIVNPPTRTTFITPDGFVYGIFVRNGDTAQTPTSDVFIDINGGNGPNTLGKDVFWFGRVVDIGVVPVGRQKTNEEILAGCSKSKTSNGFYCAERIKRAGWNIDKDYPW